MSLNCKVFCDWYFTFNSFAPSLCLRSNMIFLLQETETQSYVPFLAHIVKECENRINLNQCESHNQQNS